MANILLTGANGFVGSALSRELSKRDYRVREAYRNLPVNALSNHVLVGEINASTHWKNALQNIDTVIHLAARVHVMDEQEADPLTAFRRVNVAGSIALAEQMAAAGCKRLIYISSLKVNGECTQQPFNESMPAAPQDAYGVSKWEAEQALQTICRENNMELVIIRPPLIYGPQVGGNFLRLLNLLNRGIPLPFASIKNQRSMLYVENFVDFIIQCINHPKAANQIFLLSDGHDLSVAQLIKTLATLLHKSYPLFPLPASLLYWTARLSGKQHFYDRLCGSLQADISKAQTLLNWHAPYTVEESLRATVAWYTSC